MSQPLILCIDDDPLSIKVLESFLSGHFRVSTAPSARGGLAAIEQEVPDLIISDVLMPDMNGFEMVSKLREIPEATNIPLIFISALSQLGNIGKSENSGITQFFSKPIDNEQLLDNIHRLLGTQSDS
ncbi:MAG: response regulator [Gammaproteobacteria bacterium]|nr:response regulator [Gammaproteobacteria bacterium]